MPKKLGKTRAKGGRPTKAKQVEIRKKCEEEYMKYHSAAYAASKAGVLALTKSLAVEYAKKGLQVNCVNPGGIKTAMTRMPPIEDIDMDLLLRQNPLTPFVEPEAVASLIAYLASDEGRHINGEHVRIDGAALA